MKALLRNRNVLLQFKATEPAAGFPVLRPKPSGLGLQAGFPSFLPSWFLSRSPDTPPSIS